MIGDLVRGFVQGLGAFLTNYVWNPLRQAVKRGRAEAERDHLIDTLEDREEYEDAKQRDIEETKRILEESGPRTPGGDAAGRAGSGRMRKPKRGKGRRDR